MDIPDKGRPRKQKEPKVAKTYDHLVAIDGLAFIFFVISCSKKCFGEPPKTNTRAACAPQIRTLLRREGGDDFVKQFLDLPDDIEAIISVKLGEQIPRIRNVY